MLQNRINSVRIKNYRSLKDVTVDFSDLTILIGLNGSGKSNVLDALAFVADALNYNLEYAVNERGGKRYLEYFTPERGHDIEFHFNLTIDGKDATYKLILGGIQDFSVRQEYFRVYGSHYEYETDADGVASYNTSVMNLEFPPDSKNLALNTVGSLDTNFRKLRDFLRQMRKNSFLFEIAGVRQNVKKIKNSRL